MTISEPPAARCACETPHALIAVVGLGIALALRLNLASAAERLDQTGGIDLESAIRMIIRRFPDRRYGVEIAARAARMGIYAPSACRAAEECYCR